MLFSLPGVVLEGVRDVGANLGIGVVGIEGKRLDGIGAGNGTIEVKGGISEAWAGRT